MILARRFYHSICFIALLCSLSTAAQTKPQTTPASETLLTVGGEVEKPMRLSAADFAQLPRQTVRAKDHDGREYTFEGVALYEILQRAGMPSGEHLRGKSLATYLLVEAADGYRAVFALPELDPAGQESAAAVEGERCVKADLVPVGDAVSQFRCAV